MINEFKDLYSEIKYNKDGSPNKNSLKKKVNVDKAIKVLQQYSEDSTLVFHHKAIVNGQLSRTTACVPKSYNGIYGTGITVDVPYFGKGSKYIQRYYFINKGDN